MRRLGLLAAATLAAGPGAASACTIIFTEESEARALREADLVVTAEARFQSFDRKQGNVQSGTGEAVVVDVQTGRIKPGAKVSYAVKAGDDGLCPALWSAEPGRLYKLYLKRSEGGGPMQIIHREPHFGP